MQRIQKTKSQADRSSNLKTDQVVKQKLHNKRNEMTKKCLRKVHQLKQFQENKNKKNRFHVTRIIVAIINKRIKNKCWNGSERYKNVYSLLGEIQRDKALMKASIENPQIIKRNSII